MLDTTGTALPGNRDFYQPLLQVLGQITQFTVGSLVQVTDQVIHRVIRAAGYNPDNLAQYGDPKIGWAYDGRSNPPGFKRRVTLAYRFLYEVRSNPFTLRGKQRGWWGLTQAGVDAAKKQESVAMPAPVAEPTRPQKNLTAKFLDQRIASTGGLTGSFWVTLQRVVAMKMPVSAATGQIEDHLQNCITRLVSRDALKSRLLEGLPITDQQLATYAVRGAYNDARNAGTDPVTREMLGARTERERSKGIRLGPLTDDRLVWDMDAVGTDASTWVDIADTHGSLSAEAAEDAIRFQELWAQLETAVKTQKPHAGERYVGILKKKVAGASMQEIADSENVSLFRASAILAEARRCLRAAASDGMLDELFDF